MAGAKAPPRAPVKAAMSIASACVVGKTMLSGVVTVVPQVEHTMQGL